MASRRGLPRFGAPKEGKGTKKFGFAYGFLRYPTSALNGAGQPKALYYKIYYILRAVACASRTCLFAVMSLAVTTHSRLCISTSQLVPPLSNQGHVVQRESCTSYLQERRSQLKLFRPPERDAGSTLAMSTTFYCLSGASGYLRGGEGRRGLSPLHSHSSRVTLPSLTPQSPHLSCAVSVSMF